MSAGEKNTGGADGGPRLLLDGVVIAEFVAAVADFDPGGNSGGPQAVVDGQNEGGANGAAASGELLLADVDVGVASMTGGDGLSVAAAIAPAGEAMSRGV